MIPLHLARIRGGMANPPLRFAILFVQKHADRRKKTRNGDHSCSSDREKEERLMGVESDAAFRTTH